VNAMQNPGSVMAQEVAKVVSASQHQRTGLVPEAVTVVLSDTTLVVTLHGALSPAERALAKTPAGAAQVQEFHRQLFTNSAEPLCQEIKRITGVDVRQAIAEVEPATGAVLQVFNTGTVVQVFLLAEGIAADAWNRSDPVTHP
jgi:uncharacterized protein YbcI